MSIQVEKLSDFPIIVMTPDVTFEHSEIVKAYLKSLDMKMLADEPQFIIVDIRNTGARFMSFVESFGKLLRVSVTDPLTFGSFVGTPLMQQVFEDTDYVFVESMSEAFTLAESQTVAQMMTA